MTQQKVHTGLDRRFRLATQDAGEVEARRLEPAGTASTMSGERRTVASS